MPVCATCDQSLNEAEFSPAQLKNGSGRACCTPCLGAAAIAKEMAANPPPMEDMLSDALKMAMGVGEEPAAVLSCHVEEKPGIGRVLTAARDFQPGELVLREPPTLVWSAASAGTILAAFLEADPRVQADVLEQPTRPDADLGQIDNAAERATVAAARQQQREARTGLAQRIAEGYQGSARIVELCEALLAVADASAFAFGADRAGLFPLAALANHSCSPSCGHSTRVGGEMRFFASVPISRGDEVTISHLPALWATPRDERRRVRMLQHAVFCRCARCAAADGCRGLRCVGAACDGVAERADGAGGKWACGRCGEARTDGAMRPQLEAEAALLLRAGNCKRAAPAAGGAPAVDSAAPAADVLAVAIAVREALSPSHYLGPRLLCAALEPPPPPRTAASAACQALATLECASASCHERTCARAGVTKHEARAELVGEAATAVLACVAAGTADLVALAAIIGSRYLPWAMRQFGPDDIAVKAMRAALERVGPKA